MLRTEPDWRDLTPTQYELALEWLRARGLYDGSGRIEDPWRSSGAIVLRAAIEADEPPWLAAADALIRDPADLPIDVTELGLVLGVDDTEMFEQVEQAWRKFDDTARRRLGAAGELALVDWLHANARAEVVHVSVFDDTVGYDVALLVAGQLRARVEIKTTRRTDAVVLFVSRNEVETLRRHSTWCLQVVHLDPSDKLVALSWIPGEVLLQGAPNDGDIGTWQSMKLVLPGHALRSGAAPQISALLNG
ncbi:protein NO VEIN domain-containing protein [Microbacterium sp. NPDC087592]|uniref:protein NO VEIN domain-containing protein n=1 Tax=Microbacterium sp. NPDC087592 TaxID=3364193 RepID=UPI00381C6C9D